MSYYYIEPEVAGGHGDKSVLDTRPHPPIVYRLEYTFAGWMGDALLETFPCYICTDAVANAIIRHHFTGTEIADVEITFSPEYFGRYDKDTFPHFHWLKIVGAAGADDFGIGSDLRLVVSEKALSVLRSLGIEHAEVEPVK